MISIAICDDDRKTTESIEKMLRETAAEFRVEICCESFYDGMALMEVIAEQKVYFDLIYLDIEMQGMDGIHTARKLRDMSFPVLIIYVSGHEEYLKELFLTEPFRFLAKPIAKDQFRDFFYSACRRIQQRAECFSFTYRKVFHKIPYAKIAYFESNGRVVSIHTAGIKDKDADGGIYRFYGRMSDLEKQVSSENDRFVRIHQSFLVNFDYARSISFSNVVMADSRMLQISEDRRKAAREQFGILVSDMEKNIHE